MKLHGLPLNPQLTCCNVKIFLPLPTIESPQNFEALVLCVYPLLRNTQLLTTHSSSTIMYVRATEFTWQGPRN